MSDISRRGAAGCSRSESATEPMSDYRILDPHVHVWKHDPQFPFAEGARPPERDATPDTLLELMKANGVEQDGHHSGDSLPLRQPYLADVLKHYPKISRASAGWIRWIRPRPTISRD